MDDHPCTWQELVRRAGSARRARTWVAGGDWRRVVRGAYAPWSAEDGVELRAQCLALVLPPDVALSHRSALWLLGLDVLGEAVDVTVPRGRHLAPRPGLRVHTAELEDDVLVQVRGLTAVTAARAVVDVARSEGLVEAVALGDAALRSGAARRTALLAVLDDSVGLRGVRRARAAVALLSCRSESPMESRLRVRLLQGGVGEVEVQVDLYDAGGHVARADLLVRGVVVEFDGREVHLERRAFAHDRRRQSRLLAAGAELCRFTAADVYGRSEHDLAGEVLRAVARAHARGGPALDRGPDTLRPPRLRPLPSLAEVRARLPRTG